MADNLTLRAGINLNAQQFNQGLRKAEGRARDFNRNVGAAIGGAFAAAAIGRGVKALVSSAGEIRDTARAYGLTAEEFQGLDFAAKQTGASVNDFLKSIKSISIAQQSALEGQKEYTDMMNRLGISMDDLRSMSPQDLFREIAKRVESGELGVQNMADLFQLMGRNAANVLPAMQDGLDGTIAKFNEMGAAISTEGVEELAALGDEATTVWAMFKKAGATALLFVLDKLRQVGNMVKAIGAYMGGLAAGFTEVVEAVAQKMQKLLSGDIAGFLADKAPREALEKMLNMASEQFMDELLRQDEEDAERKREKKELVEKRELNAKRAQELAAGVNAQTEANAAQGRAGVGAAASSKMSADALARIGGFTGRGGLAAVSIQKKIASAATETAKNTEAIKRNLNGI